MGEYKVVGSKHSARAGCGHKVKAGDNYYIMPYGKGNISVCCKCCTNDKNKIVVEAQKVCEVVSV